MLHQKFSVAAATENFYLLLITSYLLPQIAPENFEVRSNSEEVRSESYIGSDLSPNAPSEQANPNCFVTTELFGFVFFRLLHPKYREAFFRSEQSVCFL